MKLGQTVGFVLGFFFYSLQDFCAVRDVLRSQCGTIRREQRMRCERAACVGAGLVMCFQGKRLAQENMFPEASCGAWSQIQEH